MEENTLNKIRALLAKAERTDNPHEAEAFTAKSVELMEKYAIDEATVRAGTHERPIITNAVIVVEGPYVIQKVTLLDVLANANRCQLICVGGSKKNKTTRIFGRSDDIQFVEMLFNSLLIQQVLEVNKATIPPRENTRTFRTAFFQGYAVVIRNRFLDIKKAMEPETTQSVALVLRDDKKASEQALFAEYPDTKTVVRRMNTASQGFGKGAEAGTRADLGAGRIGSRKMVN